MKNFVSCDCGGAWRDHGYAALRVVTGLAFFYHGYGKVFGEGGVQSFVPFFSSVGIPFPELMTYLVAYGELAAGIGLILGLFTHWAAKISTVIMIGAIGFVHWGAEGGWFFGYGADGGYEYQLLLLAASVFFLVSGPGKFSLDTRRAQKMGGGMM
jgi:putative oxidoreductase